MLFVTKCYSIMLFRRYLACRYGDWNLWSARSSASWPQKQTRSAFVPLQRALLFPYLFNCYHAAVDIGVVERTFRNVDQEEVLFMISATNEILECVYLRSHDSGPVPVFYAQTPLSSDSAPTHSHYSLISKMPTFESSYKRVKT